ncbi:MAG: sugar phosphate isomerase/epimerase [Clostridia bacterium]|nr:sugar phosphate isomerase/epimerase [Clostridia bacterium]
MKPSVSSYSFQQLISSGEITQFEAIALAAEIGFEGIEFTDLRPNNKKDATLEEQLEFARALREEAKRCGIAIVSYTIGADLYKGSDEADAAEVKRVMDQVKVAAELGAPTMRHDVCYKAVIGDRTVGFDRMLPTIAKNARAITEFAATLGVRTCSENHGKIAQDSDRVERLYYAVDHENYGLLVDMGNFACADEDSALAVSRVAPYAIHVHVKDFVKIPFGKEAPEGLKTFSTRAQNLLAGCAIGDGDIPVAQCLAILKAAGYDGYVSIEFEGSKPCLDELRLGISRLKAMIG